MATVLPEATVVVMLLVFCLDVGTNVTSDWLDPFPREVLLIVASDELLTVPPELAVAETIDAFTLVPKRTLNRMNRM